MADLIDRNHCSIAVEPENAELFSDAVIELADHPELRKEYGNNGRALAKSEFARVLLGGQFVDFLESKFKVN